MSIQRKVLTCFTPSNLLRLGLIFDSLIPIRPCGVLAALPASVATSGTTERVVVSAQIAASSVSVGQMFKIRAQSTHAATLIPTYRVRVGPLGTTADPIAGQVSGVTGLVGSSIDFHATVRAIGPSGTVHASGRVVSGVASALSPSSVPAATVPTTAPWFITLTVQASLSVLTIQEASIQSL